MLSGDQVGRVDGNWKNHSRLGFPNRDMYHFPNFVNVEVFRGACPCRCVHCPVGITEPAERRQRFGLESIDLELYDKITQEVAKYPWSTVRIHSVGEPILWVGLVDALKIGKRNGARSWIFTSAVTGDRSLLDALCMNVAVIEVSVNSATSEDYRETKGIDCFETVRDNIEYMHSLKKRLGYPVRLIASRTQTPDQAADEAFVNYWESSGLVDSAFVRTYHSYNGLLDERIRRENRPTHQACLVHWGRFNISIDGDAIVCFNELFKRELDPRLVYGNVNKVDISEIWHGEKISALRHAALVGDYQGLTFADALPCKSCYSCQPLVGKNQTSEYQIERLNEG